MACMRAYPGAHMRVRVCVFVFSHWVCVFVGCAISIPACCFSKGQSPACSGRGSSVGGAAPSSLPSVFSPDSFGKPWPGPGRPSRCGLAARRLCHALGWAQLAHCLCTPPTTEVAHPTGGPLPHSDDKKACIIEPPNQSWKGFQKCSNSPLSHLQKRLPGLREVK